MIEHLVVSTAVLAAALLAARFIPMTARTRYALLLVALLKLVVPTAIFDFFPAAELPAMFRTFGGGAAVTAAEAAPSTNWPLLAYAAVALLVLGRWLLLRTRTVSAALQNAAPASPREADAVRDARIALRLRTAIDVVRSPLCEAPAVLRTIRPVMILPSRGCDDLDDDELRSLVLHEYAHVARYDNLAALVQAVATSLFWLHPLVWLASRALTAAREQACDEAVAEEMRTTEPYLDAMTKICVAIAAPRTAGVSCMASSNLKERTEHLMNYESIKQKALSHRAIVAASIAVIAFSTIAMATSGVNSSGGYKLTSHVSESTGGTVQFRFQVTDKEGNVIAAPQVKTLPNDPAVLTSTTETNGVQREVRIEARGTHEQGEIRLQVTENGNLVTETTSHYTQSSSSTRAPHYTGDPISINVRKANLADIMNTFSAMTGMKITVDKDVRDVEVTIEAKGVPWDELLDRIAHENGLLITVSGKTIRVSKK